MKKDDLFSEDNTATYCPEDDKLRLYVGRVPREEYLDLKAEGWTSTPKQDCDFVAVWTQNREDTALSYAGIILDEDQSPEDRAADRAERFGGYLDKRLDEATGHADRYDDGPSAHGYQSQARADRAAARHDRIATRATDAWSKAEYWQRRTAGVISNALYKSSPGVRMGRIKTIEADIRKAEKSLENRARVYRNFQKLAAVSDPEKQTEMLTEYTGNESELRANYKHPAPKDPERYHAKNKVSLYSLLSHEEDPITGAQACELFFSDHSEPPTLEDGTRYINHLRLRVAYEMQMLEAQGGRAAMVEMEIGGWLGSYQIHAINKSPKTGRVVSVKVREKDPVTVCHWGRPLPEGQTRIAWHTINIERLATSAYTPPTEEEKAAFLVAKKAAKKAAPKSTAPALINPTREDAERLQAIMNARCVVPSYVKDHKPSEVLELTQAQYSANSKGTYARLKTQEICAEGKRRDRGYNSDVSNARRGPVLCKLRMAPSGGNYAAKRVIVITDKPRKPLPAAIFSPFVPADTRETLAPRVREIAAAVAMDCGDRKEPGVKELIFAAEVVGLVSGALEYRCTWTEEGYVWARDLGAFTAPVNA